MDKKRGPKKSRSGYAPTKDNIKDDNNNDDDNNKGMDNVDLDSKDPCRTELDMMWENGGPGLWAPDYKEQYDLKDAEWNFDVLLHIMNRMNVSDYVDSDIDLKLR